jgi:hypothetical protein
MRVEDKMQEITLLCSACIISYLGGNGEKIEAKQKTNKTPAGVRVRAISELPFYPLGKKVP